MRMQLKKVTGSLAAATCSLLGATTTGPTRG
jgi:hypothetical protein